jgi:MoaA/NifB/PqqE/SkfB family radical SAM enzyme
MKKETFCSLPFSALFLGSDGGVRPCCSLRGELGNINETSVEEIIQGEIVTSIRRSIINNEMHSMCSQCQELESRGARTERTGTIELYDKFKDYTEKDFSLEKLDLRWSNTCNLTCNYCYEYFSSKWAEIKGIKINANKETAEEKVFSFIEQNLKDKPDVRFNVNLLGGEPLLQKPNSRLIELIKNNSDIYILTNLTVPLETNKVASLLLEGDNVAWGISFETIGNRFEYVRKGGDWNQLVKNFRFLNQHNVKHIDSHPLYCAYSAFNLVEYFEFIGEEGYFHKQYWQVLQNIPGLDVFQLPYPMKVKAIKELETCFHRYESTFDLSLLKSVHSGLESSIDKQYWDSKACFTWLDDLEKSIPGQKQSFIDNWPELYDDMLNTHSWLTDVNGNMNPKTEFDRPIYVRKI